ncbi:hypothetical protein DL98DRAFT_617711 [Cadophora sp. DSE1049]|nr:hypothetical protein DL98DRAFT_617711 [Cadophora sp. DSE1049]
MTKLFSNEWATKGIQVNGVAPGFMRTLITDGYAADPKYTEYLMSRVPSARWGHPNTWRVLWYILPVRLPTLSPALLWW